MIKNSAKNTVLMIFSILFSCLSLYLVAFLFFIAAFENFPVKQFDEDDDSDDEYDIPLSDDEALENVEETTENA